MLQLLPKGAGNRASYKLLPALARVLIGYKLGHFESIEQAYLSVMEPQGFFVNAVMVKGNYVQLILTVKLPVTDFIRK